MYSCAHKVFVLPTFKLSGLFFAMVPLHGICEAREELNCKTYTLHKYARWDYKQTAKELGIEKSRGGICGVKRGNLWGKEGEFVG